MACVVDVLDVAGAVGGVLRYGIGLRVVPWPMLAINTHFTGAGGWTSEVACNGAQERAYGSPPLAATL